MKRHVGPETLQDSSQMAFNLFAKGPDDCSQIPKLNSHDLNSDDYQDGYTRTQRGVSLDIITFLDKFYDNFPEFRKSELYLASESYGGIFFDGKRAVLMRNREIHTLNRYSDFG